MELIDTVVISAASVQAKKAHAIKKGDIKGKRGKENSERSTSKSHPRGKVSFIKNFQTYDLKYPYVRPYHNVRIFNPQT